MGKKQNPTGKLYEQVAYMFGGDVAEQVFRAAVTAYRSYKKRGWLVPHWINSEGGGHNVISMIVGEIVLVLNGGEGPPSDPIIEGAIRMGCRNAASYLNREYNPTSRTAMHRQVYIEDMGAVSGATGDIYSETYQNVSSGDHPGHLDDDLSSVAVALDPISHFFTEQERRLIVAYAEEGGINKAAAKIGMANGTAERMIKRIRARVDRQEVLTALR